MPELRQTIKRELIEVLDETTFTVDDFTVDFGGKGNDLVFKVTFIHDSEFYFDVRKRATGAFRIILTPGTLEVSENRQAKNFSEVLALIPNWAFEVRNELKAKQPIYREMDELRKTIEESINSSVTEEEEFSVSEVNELRRKFSALEERVDDLEKQSIITKSQHEKFSKNIHQVSEDIEVYPKKTWIKTSINKLTKTVSLIGKSKEGRAILADGARKLLGVD